jgi:hypothetical protein
MKNSHYILKFLLGIIASSGLLQTSLIAEDTSSMQPPPAATKTFTDAEGDSVQIDPDGTKTIKKADGSMIQVKPDGTKIVQKADGSRIEIKPAPAK